MGNAPSAARPVTSTVSKESLILLAICLVDALLSIVLLATGLAEEANPLMAACLDHGFAVFYLVKMASVVPAVVVAELYRRRNPVFIRRLLRGAIVAYITLYFSLLFAVNFA